MTLDAAHHPSVSLSPARRAELALAAACANGDPAAIAELERRYWPLVDAISFRLGATPVTAAEAKQILRCRLLVAPAGRLPHIASFHGQGPLAAWIAIAASRVLWRLKKQELRQPDENAALACVVCFDDPEIEHVRTRSIRDFSAAFGEAVASLAVDDRQLLRASLLERRGIDVLAAEHGLHRSTVARRLERIRGALRDRTKAILAERLALSPPEVQSLVRLAIEGMPAIAL